ncbi:trypsin-like peptidase domain-containing protein [Aquibium sp. LZ166]|uniref:Trypsin-like peptidase domain-containing protein n=1 Tax=Aquibium pacificus TaxID=3153579 RepID=A0ABV3SJE3_9HYPH
MFRNAVSTAMGFTRPVVISRQAKNGACSSSIGAFVVVNEEGWILTAAHVMTQISELLAQEAAFKKTELEQQEIEKLDISSKEKRKKLHALPKYSNDHTINCSVWWSHSHQSVQEAHLLPHADLALAKLDNFDPNSVSVYPTFKDPGKDYEPGTSLCKLGFPFHSITPIWETQTCSFRLPAGAIPIPFFPIEGIFTRVAQIVLNGAPPPPIPHLWVESSSPGLRGQSGGPTFDTQGTIWAIQANTAHMPLGFNARVSPNSRDNVPQFLNVGRGVHMKTVLGLLDQRGVKHIVSAY